MRGEFKKLKVNPSADGEKLKIKYQKLKIK